MNMVSKISNKKTHIVVFRGGNLNHGESVKEGKDVFSHLKKNDISFSDVYVDDGGVPIKDGARADIHDVLANSDGYIDTTGHSDLDHHNLAKKMGLKKLFSDESSASMALDRESVYRVLRAHDVLVPDTFVVRKENNDFVKDLKEVWTTFHTPFLVRVLVDANGFPSKLIKGFHELVETVAYLHSKGHDVHIMNYKSVPTYSLAVLPKYRGDEWYTPMIIETSVKKYEVPHKDCHLKLLLNAESKEKESISNLAKRAAEVIDIKGPVCVDIIRHNGKHMVVNISLNPSLSSDGRFIKSIESTGVNFGDLIEKQIS